MNEYEKLTNELIKKAINHSFHLHAQDKVDFAFKCYNQIFGNSFDSFPSIVVAGTKGKGSTCAVIESILRHSGLKTGLFTSPHLETPRERIKINGKCISEDQYVDAYKFLTNQNNIKIDSTFPFFGMHTLLSKKVFNDEKIDVAVIECGIGGRFDWTKIYKPFVSVITHLEYDHVNVLGKTPESIAWNKAGILSIDSEGFTVPQTTDFMKPLLYYSVAQRSHLNIINPIWEGKMGLRGPTAQENTALGAAVAKYVCKKFNKQINIEKGVENSQIFGRYQIFTEPKDKTYWMLDGAHTTESINSCAEWYQNLARKIKDDVLITSVTNGRHLNMLKPILKNNFKKKIFVKSDTNQEEHLFKSYNLYQVNSLSEAITTAKNSNPNGILVTGSLRLVGDTLKAIHFPII